ncbi:MAG: hypothetical protein SGJ20_08965 [Planctomycetota bacterium]|nr:hypothetical protein [Planctomycetota bacterium]
MNIDFLSWVLRFLHIVAAITAVGGSIFIRFALLPSTETLDATQRQTLNDQVRRRWSRLIQLSILFLLVSGVINFWSFYQTTKHTPGWAEWRTQYNSLYQTMFGMKFMLALAIFALASILSGKSAGTQKFRDQPRFWLNLNLGLALAVVAISGIMRLTHVGPTLPAETPPGGQARLEPGSVVSSPEL